VPTEFLAEATIPETHRAALIAWLRSLTGQRPSVRFNWGRPDPLTLTCVDNDGKSATFQVPVAVQGIPPVIAFEPLFLASALEIGPTLRFIDGMSPLLASGPGGVFCVLMPMRCTDRLRQPGNDHLQSSPRGRRYPPRPPPPRMDCRRGHLRNDRHPVRPAPPHHGHDHPPPDHLSDLPAVRGRAGDAGLAYPSAGPNLDRREESGARLNAAIFSLTQERHRSLRVPSGPGPLTSSPANFGRESSTFPATNASVRH
jgi:hypothetical protein